MPVTSVELPTSLRPGRPAKDEYLRRKGDTIELLLSTMVNELISSEAEDPIQHLLTMLQERRGLPPAPAALPAPSPTPNAGQSTLLQKELDAAKEELKAARAEVDKYKEQAKQARIASTSKKGEGGHSDVINAAADAAQKIQADEKFKEWSVSSWIGKLVGDRVQAALLQPLTDKVGKDMNPSQALDFMQRLRGETGAVRDLLDTADVLGGVTDDVESAIADLSGGTGSVQHLSKKFAEATFELSYGDLGDFHSGLEGVIGPPDPKLLDAMHREHCTADDSSEFFTSTNYAVHTTSSVEWYYVVDPNGEGPEHFRTMGLEKWPGEAPDNDIPIAYRRMMSTPGAPRTLQSFDDEFERINRELGRIGAKPLLKEELIGGRMYTGPLFVKYNLVLRAKPKAPKHEGYAKTILDQHTKMCKGNLYATTIHVLNSCIVKLSKLTRVGKVYRGLADGALPERFFTPDTYNVKGGVEPAFMSTTADEEIAKAYAGQGGIILALDQGMVSRGADLSWFSQYPHEKEVLFAPLTGIEKKAARVHQGKCIIVDMALSVNLTTPTIDEVIGKMQNSFVGMVRSMKDDLAHLSAPTPALAPLEGVLKDTRQRGRAYFNVAGLFEKATAEALKAKDQSIHLLGKPESWPEVDEDGRMKERMQLAAHHCASEEEPGVAASILIMMEQRFPRAAELQRHGRDGGGEISHEALVQEITDGRKGRVNKEEGKQNWPSDDESSALVAASCLLKSGISQRNPWPLVLITLCEMGGDRGAATRIAKAHEYPASIVEGQLFYKDATVIARKSNRLLQAAGMGDVAGIKDALEDMGDDAINQSADNGITPLILASHEVSVEAVELLLCQPVRADPNLVSASGCTALTVAVDRDLPGTGAIVKKLLDARADVNAKTSEGMAAIHKACNMGLEDAIKALIAGKANVNLPGDRGWTPLMMAGQNGHVKICKALIDEGANVDARTDKPGTTALIDASYNGREEIVKLLLESKLVKEIDAADDYGDTSMACAVSSGHLSIVKLLIEHKADVNKGKKTPLTKALKKLNDGRSKEIFDQIVDALTAAGGIETPAPEPPK